MEVFDKYDIIPGAFCFCFAFALLFPLLAFLIFLSY